jgi:hypothetical protein
MASCESQKVDLPSESAKNAANRLMRFLNLVESRITSFKSLSLEHRRQPIIFSLVWRRSSGD